MRRFVVTIMASLLSCSAAQAFLPEAVESSIEVGVGYRKDKLEWKTSTHPHGSGSSSSYGDGYGFPVKAESKLKWKDLSIWQIEAIGKYVTCDNIYLRGNADYGWITDGKNTDTDTITLGDAYSEGASFEHKTKSKSKGHVYDIRLAIGYQFKMCDDSFSISPLIGYSWNAQKIKDRHSKDSSSDSYFADVDGELIRARSSSSHYASYSEYGSYGSSDSSYGSSGKNNGKYHTRWNGPFLGFDFDYRFGCGCEADWELFGTYEFHWAQYHAKAHWPHRSDIFKGEFRHHAKDAYGQVFDIGLKWDFCECWTVALKGEFQWWWADKGHDRAKTSSRSIGDVSRTCSVKIPLKDIKWDSASISVDVGMVF